MLAVKKPNKPTTTTTTTNIKGVALENKIGQQKSICVDYGSKKLTFLKQVKHKK